MLRTCPCCAESDMTQLLLQSVASDIGTVSVPRAHQNSCPRVNWLRAAHEPQCGCRMRLINVTEAELADAETDYNGCQPALTGNRVPLFTINLVVQATNFAGAMMPKYELFIEVAIIWMLHTHSYYLDPRLAMMGNGYDPTLLNTYAALREYVRMRKPSVAVPCFRKLAHCGAKCGNFAGLHTVCTVCTMLALGMNATQRSPGICVAISVSCMSAGSCWRCGTQAQSPSSTSSGCCTNLTSPRRSGCRVATRGRAAMWRTRSSMMSRT